MGVVVPLVVAALSDDESEGLGRGPKPFGSSPLVEADEENGRGTSISEIVEELPLRPLHNLLSHHFTKIATIGASIQSVCNESWQVLAENLSSGSEAVDEDAGFSLSGVFLEELEDLLEVSRDSHDIVCLTLNELKDLFGKKD